MLVVITAGRQTYVLCTVATTTDAGSGYHVLIPTEAATAAQQRPVAPGKFVVSVVLAASEDVALPRSVAVATDSVERSNADEEVLSTCLLGDVEIEVRLERILAEEVLVVKLEELPYICAKALLMSYVSIQYDKECRLDIIMG